MQKWPLVNNPDTSSVANERRSIQDTVVSALDEQIEPHFPQNRDSSESKLRRDKKRCPICLRKLGKIVGRTRLLKFRQNCQARKSMDKRCKKCQAAGKWENKIGAACQSCGLHGKKSVVILQE